MAAKGQTKEKLLHNALMGLTSSWMDQIIESMDEDKTEEERVVSWRLRLDKAQKKMADDFSKKLATKLKKDEVKRFCEIIDDEVFKKASVHLAAEYSQLIVTQVLQVQSAILSGVVFATRSVFGFVKGMFPVKKKAEETEKPDNTDGDGSKES